MATGRFFERYKLLSEATRLLQRTQTIDAVLEVLRRQARAIAEADGVAVIRRTGDRVHYVGEDAIAPLWAGQTFPIADCISGLAILERRPLFIPDVTADARVPLRYYLPTFVRSMAMYPLGSPAPIAALGLYWREPTALGRDLDALMTMLASSANAAFQGLAIQRETAGVDDVGGIAPPPATSARAA